MGVAERAGGREDIDHRHGMAVPFRSAQLPRRVQLRRDNYLQDRARRDIRMRDERGMPTVSDQREDERHRAARINPAEAAWATGTRRPERIYVMRLASCVRDFTSSFRNAFRRWYSTVLGLMNSCAAISRFVFPSAAS